MGKASMTEQQFFEYGVTETDYLKSRCARMAWAIDEIGHIRRPVQTDMFAALINSIVGQQIATKAQQTIWKRMADALGAVTPESIAACSDEQLQSFGLSWRKVDYIKEATRRVLSGELDLEELAVLPDDEVRARLSALPGIGVWTAEMLMIFAQQRPDIISYGDLAILRGLRMLHRHRCITPELFRKYCRRYSPYGTVASLYLWAIAGGAIPELTDPAPKQKPKSSPRAKK